MLQSSRFTSNTSGWSASSFTAVSIILLGTQNEPLTSCSFRSTVHFIILELSEAVRMSFPSCTSKRKHSRMLMLFFGLMTLLRMFSLLFRAVLEIENLIVLYDLFSFLLFKCVKLPTKIQNFCVIWKNILNKIVDFKNILVISPTKTASF